MLAREAIAVPIAFASLLFLLLAFAFPAFLLEQARDDARDLRELKSVQVYIDGKLSLHGSLPTDDQIRHWAETQQLDLAHSVSTRPLGCLDAFSKAPKDRYLVGFWNGEWSECLSSPSGVTTLRPSVVALLRSGLWKVLMLSLTLGIGLGWVAWKLLLRSPSGGKSG